MRCSPVFPDFSSGTVALIGSGSAVAGKLRLLRAAGADVRWYCGNLDVAEEVILASAPPGRLELSFADPLEADYSKFAAVVAAERGVRVDDIVLRARANNVPIN